jgi:hypothetical protein
VPDEFTNEISTNVKVKNGQTLVLGGLFQEDTTVTNSQVPFLGDIPLLGAAFSGHDNTVNRREIIFLITPNIVEDELIEESGRQGTAFVNSLRAGMREGLLPFSREKMSSQHNQNAFEAASSGDTELALYHLDNSLRLNPAQPEVRRMRAKLTGQTDGGFYDYDMFNRVMQGMHEDHADRKADEARLDAETDPLAPASVPVQTAASSSEERFVEALVDDLDMPVVEETVEVADATEVEDSSIDIEALEEAIFLVEAEPMTVEEAFGGETEVGEVGFETEETVVAEAMVEETYDDDCVVEPMTTDNALAIVADSQRRLVSGPRNSAWGRLWWLARIAGDQARAFALRDAESTTTGTSDDTAIATVNDED